MLRRHIREQTLSLPNHPKLIAELLSIRETQRPGGGTHFETGGRDIASALIAILHGLQDPEMLGMHENYSPPLRGIPHGGPPNVRHSWHANSGGFTD
jgi:hypothetical protein